MLKVDGNLTHLTLPREAIIGLYESINQPLVNIPNFGTAPTGAYVLCARGGQSLYSVFVYLHQPETRAVIIYVSEPRYLTLEQYRMEENEAIRFVESMGFMIDNLHFPTLPPDEQSLVMSRIPIFRPQQRTVDLYDVAEEIPEAEIVTSSGELDALFGGLSSADSELFRRAGLDARRSAPAETLLPREQPRPPKSESRPEHKLEQRRPEPKETKPEPKPEPSPELLERVGRLLGAFSVLFLVSTGCRAGGAEDIKGERAVESHVDLGNQHLAQGQWAQAIQTFTQVLEEDPNNRDALRGNGLGYLSLGRTKEAEHHYRLAIQADPKWSIPKNELAVLLTNQRNCEEAEALLREVLADIYYPTPEFAENNLANALACQGQWEAALNLASGLTLKRPQFCLGYLTLAELSVQSKRPQGTIEACEGFRAHCEENEDIRKLIAPDQSALCNLRKGLAYAELGDVESARAAFSRCGSESRYGKECLRSLDMLPP